MRYDRELGYARYGPRGWRGERLGRGEYGPAYEAPYRGIFHGYAMGYSGGALRSRGSFEAGQLRSGMNPEDEFEFEWGEGYVGGRGYGGTNYDLEHGYRTGGIPRYYTSPPRPERPPTSPATRGGYEWGEALRAETGEPYGPARYGYGPYFERLQRRRRPDDEIRNEVEEALFYDTWVDADRITVEVKDGIVTLKGELPDYNEIRYATDDAWDVDGVRGVRSELTVARGGRQGAGRRGIGELGVERGRTEAEGAAAMESAGSTEAAAAVGAPAPRGQTRRAGKKAEQAGGSTESGRGTRGSTRSRAKAEEQGDED